MAPAKNQTTPASERATNPQQFDSVETVHAINARLTLAGCAIRSANALGVERDDEPETSRGDFTQECANAVVCWAITEIHTLVARLGEFTGGTKHTAGAFDADHTSLQASGEAGEGLGPQDPIFAMIEANKRAYRVLDLALDIPETPELQERRDEAEVDAHDICQEVEVKLSETFPTTAEGALALLGHVCTGSNFEMKLDSEPVLRNCLINAYDALARFSRN